jgi:hypothetical protein
MGLKGLVPGTLFVGALVAALLVAFGDTSLVFTAENIHTNPRCRERV